MIFVYGGASCGKSEYAETLALNYDKRVYLATMKIYDNTDRAKVKAHQRMRSGKGFRTIECPYNIQKIYVEYNEAVLLECLSNLLANEIFSPTCQNEDDISDAVCTEKADKLYDNILELNMKCRELIVVGNDIFAQTYGFSKAVLLYMKALLYLQNKLIKHADKAIEIICGIPTYFTEKILTGGNL